MLLLWLRIRSWAGHRRRHCRLGMLVWSSLLSLTAGGDRRIVVVTGVVLVAVIDAGDGVVVHLLLLSLTLWMGVDIVNVNSAEGKSVSGASTTGMLTYHGRHHRRSHSYTEQIEEIVKCPLHRRCLERKYFHLHPQANAGY